MESLAAVGLDGLKDLRSLAWPDDEIEKNSDILVWVANFAVPNVANLNGHLIETETAIRVASSMKNKPLNCEHEKSYIIGYVTNVGFSSYGANKLMAVEEISGNNPFNIAAAGIVWRRADRWMAEMLQDSNKEGSYLFEKMSTSWEIGYNQYKILRGSRNISMGELIEDEDEIKKLSKHLMDNGGTGLDKEGRELYTVICGDDAVFVGLAVTANPAAAVKGIGIVTPDEEEEEEEEEEDDTQEEDSKEKCMDTAMLLEKVASFESELKKASEYYKDFDKNISQKQKTIVKLRNTMNFNDKESLLNALEVSEASAVTPRMIREFIENNIQEAGTKYKELEQAKASQEQELTQNLEKVKNYESQIESLATQIQELRDEADKVKKEQVFSDRMSALAEVYNLDNEKLRKKVTKEIRDLSDVDYASWLEDDASVLLVKKADEKVETMDEAEAAEKALKESKASGHIPNTSGGEEKATPKKAWTLGEEFEIKN